VKYGDFSLIAGFISGFILFTNAVDNFVNRLAIDLSQILLWHKKLAENLGSFNVNSFRIIWLQYFDQGCQWMRENIVAAMHKFGFVIKSAGSFGNLPKLPFIFMV
jgi:hypothetical protein